MAGNVDGEGSSSRRKSSTMKCKAKLLVGEKVEVRSDDDGFQGSWHSGVVISCSIRTRCVEYDHILVDDGSDKLVDYVRVSPAVDGLVSCTVDQHNYHGSIRPVPPIYVTGPYDFLYGLCVDAFHMDAWWEGVIFDRNVGAEKRNVFFPELGDQMLTQLANIRVTQDWDEITEKWQSRGTWLFLDLICVYEQEWPIPVSLKQIWYDLREKEAFQRSKWTSRDKTLWEKLVLETINENLSIASVVLIPFLDSPRSRNSMEESCMLLELPELSSKVNHRGVAAWDEPHATVPLDGMQSVDRIYCSEKSTSSKYCVVDGVLKLSGPSDVGYECPFSNCTVAQPVEHMHDLDADAFKIKNGLSRTKGAILSNATCQTPQASRISDENFQHSSSVTFQGHSEANEKATDSTGQKCETSWQLVGRDKNSQSQCCPDAIAKYASNISRNDQNSLKADVREHLSLLGWKIEFLRGPRYKYTSPDGKCYHSLIEVCQDLRKVNGRIRIQISSGNNKSLVASGDNLLLPSTFDSCDISTDCGPNPSKAVAPSSIGVLDVRSICNSRAVVPTNKPGSDQTCYTEHKAPRVVKIDAKSNVLAVRKELKDVDEIGKPKMRCNLSRKRSHDSLVMALPYFGNNELSAAGGGEIKRWGDKRPRKTRMDRSHCRESQLIESQKADCSTAIGGFSCNTNSREAKHKPTDTARSRSMASRALVKIRGRGADFRNRIQRSSKTIQQVVPSPSCLHPRNVLSWLADNDRVLSRRKVYYRRGKNRSTLAEGRVIRGGIKCSCCKKAFTLRGFAYHAGRNDQRIASCIFLEDGRSLLDCQKQILSDRRMSRFTIEQHDKTKRKWKDGKNDSICSVCHYGGELILCDQCPSSFHQICLGLKEVPQGDWFCPSCCCAICCQSKLKEDAMQHVDDENALKCNQCERKYHLGCLRKKGATNLESYSKRDWYCSKNCKTIFLGLNKLLGKPIQVGMGNLTWTLSRSINTDYIDVSDRHIESVIETNCKLNVAIDVMHECFEPVKEPYARRDLIEDIIFSRGSELKRLNFRGFYTVLLEKNDELISVACVRVFGDKVAEVPLVGTRSQFRRRGMCRILMNELEKKLKELAVAKLVLPAVPSLINTWTTSFRFTKMTSLERLQYLDYTFLDFQDTTMCQKHLLESPSAVRLLRGMSPKIHDALKGSVNKKNLELSTTASEVSLADQHEENGTVDHGRRVHVSPFSSPGKSLGAGNAVDGESSVVSSAIGVNQPTELGSGPGFEGITKGGKDNIKVLKCYKRKKKFSAFEEFKGITNGAAGKDNIEVSKCYKRRKKFPA
ncbi:uncharacterized protein LOC115736661 [Rhodamnia argentea]|uniref:Uncharacterized protein LOC115736661 n=1 Tax=Rhodamnia argentea TaxID=178133 RepID=A0A8B8NP96_9MYRT|nr:uncharacterized protein LOC115736661 [Rhodamnia argentea]